MEFHKILSILAFLGSLLILFITSGFLSEVSQILPPEQLILFGPRVPAFSTQIAKLAPSIPIVLNIVGALSVLASVYIWRCAHPMEVKSFFLTYLSAVIIAVSALSSITLMIAYLILPHAANLA
jgi:hypothetical protein